VEEAGSGGGRRWRGPAGPLGPCSSLSCMRTPLAPLLSVVVVVRCCTPGMSRPPLTSSCLSLCFLGGGHGGLHGVAGIWALHRLCCGITCAIATCGLVWCRVAWGWGVLGVAVGRWGGGRRQVQHARRAHVELRLHTPCQVDAADLHVGFVVGGCEQASRRARVLAHARRQACQGALQRREGGTAGEVKELRAALLSAAAVSKLLGWWGLAVAGTQFVHKFNDAEAPTAPGARGASAVNGMQLTARLPVRGGTSRSAAPDGPMLS